MPVRIAPSILTADFGRITEEVQIAAAAGVDYLHLDVMDGAFVPVISFGPSLVAAIRKAVDLPIEIHMMIEHPENQIGPLRDAGGDTLSVHVEACRHLHLVVDQIKKSGARAGVCVNPGTPLSAVEPVLGDVDEVMIMSVNPGWGGQSFIESSLDKVRALRADIDRRGLAVEIEVDGGINLTTAPMCAAAGTDLLVAGSFIYNDRTPVPVNVTALKRALEGIPRQA